MKTFKLLWVYLLMTIMLPSVVSCSEDIEIDEPIELLNVSINVPSKMEPLIAPGRALKVSGTLAGNVPADAVMRVSLLDASGTEVRYAETMRKGVDFVTRAWYTGPFMVLNPTKTFDDVKFTAPEMVVRDTLSYAGAHDATIKCVYTDSTFYALITSATDVAHGLPIDDYFNLTKPDGQPYSALPNGSYTVVATILDAKGRTLGKSTQPLTIGIAKGTIVHEDNDLFVPWAVEHDVAVLIDLLPGMIGTSYNCTFMGLSWSAEHAEYMSTPVMYIMNYGLYDGGVACACEIGNILQRNGLTDDLDRRLVYHYDIGEPQLKDKKGEMVLMDETQGKMRLYRVDEVTAEAQNGLYITDGRQTLKHNFPTQDGTITVSGAEALAISGVTAPYQLKPDEIFDHPTKFAFTNFSNGLATICYTFKSETDGSVINLSFPSGIIRKQTPEENNKHNALMEFYNVIPQNTLKTGHTYQTTIQGWDRKDQLIPGMSTSFRLKVS